MKQKELAFWLKFCVIGTAICGLIIYAAIIPHLFGYVVKNNGMLQANVLPWLIVIWVSAIPCYGVLVLGWLIADNIGKDNSFSKENAKHLKWVSYLAMIDTIYFFVVNGIFLLIDKSHPLIMGICFMICFMGIAISVGSAALSHLVEKASKIQEENELTI